MKCAIQPGQPIIPKQIFILNLQWLIPVTALDENNLRDEDPGTTQIHTAQLQRRDRYPKDEADYTKIERLIICKTL